LACKLRSDTVGVICDQEKVSRDHATRVIHLYFELRLQNPALGLSQAGFGCDLVTFVVTQTASVIVGGRFVEQSIWWRQSRHQSLRDKKSFKVIRMIPSKDEVL
jgi:hypothetical protein